MITKSVRRIASRFLMCQIAFLGFSDIWAMDQQPEEKRFSSRVRSFSSKENELLSILNSKWNFPQENKKLIRAIKNDADLIKGLEAIMRESNWIPGNVEMIRGYLEGCKALTTGPATSLPAIGGKPTGDECIDYYLATANGISFSSKAEFAFYQHVQGILKINPSQELFEVASSLRGKKNATGEVITDNNLSLFDIEAAGAVIRKVSPFTGIVITKETLRQDELNAAFALLSKKKADDLPEHLTQMEFNRYFTPQ